MASSRDPNNFLANAQITGIIKRHLFFGGGYQTNTSAKNVWDDRLTREKSDFQKNIVEELGCHLVKSPAMETSIGSPVSPVSPATAALVGIP